MGKCSDDLINNFYQIRQDTIHSGELYDSNSCMVLISKRRIIHPVENAGHLHYETIYGHKDNIF